ncbi:MAG: hypothetical protein B7Y88_15990 [Sphingomonadales bacterium 32-64-17]|nr:MAG: hypothetical protein B7Y88_15990 [Sphingomonadales bacterium 32-64-17]
MSNPSERSSDAGARLEVAHQALEVILAEAARAEPEEACGLLLGADGRVLEARPAANVAQDKTRHFEIDPVALIDAYRAERGGGPRLIGYYHSHPVGPPEPSATDRERFPTRCQKGNPGQCTACPPFFPPGIPPAARAC